MSCTNPAANNYSSSAPFDDGGCLYLNKINNICYAFQDVEPEQLIDNSFTVSWSLMTNNWVFFHDYIPDMYISTREKLYSLNRRTINRHNLGPHGKVDSGTPKSFFIDVVFKQEQDFILNTISWVNEVLLAGKAQEHQTLTHITAWNNHQCTGRIALADVFELLQYKEKRETQGIWTFNDFSDMVTNGNTAFLDDLFGNFNVLSNVTTGDQPWWDKELISGNYVIVRFEFDNTIGQKMIIHDVDININTDPR